MCAMVCPSCRRSDLMPLNREGDLLCRRCQARFDANLQPFVTDYRWHSFAAMDSGKQSLIKMLLVGLVIFLTLAMLLVFYVSQLEAKRERANQLHGGAKVVMYSTSSCSICRDAKNYLVSRGISYREYNIDYSVEYRKNFAELNGYGVPLIFVDGHRMEGFRRDDFDALYYQR